MSLSDFVPNSEAVDLGKGVTVEVYPLSLADIVALFRKHMGAFSHVFDKYVGQVASQDGNDGAFDMQKAFSAWQMTGGTGSLGTVLGAFPDLAADLIAHGAREPEMSAQAATLPIGAQLELVVAITNLTMESEGGAKKLMGTVQSLISVAAPRNERSQPESGSSS